MPAKPDEALCEQLKRQGNETFKSGDYAGAARLYGEALKHWTRCAAGQWVSVPACDKGRAGLLKGSAECMAIASPNKRFICAASVFLGVCPKLNRPVDNESHPLGAARAGAQWCGATALRATCSSMISARRLQTRGCRVPLTLNTSR